MLVALMDRVGGARRAMILVVGLAAAGGMYGVAHWASEPDWVPAFGDVPLEQVGDITDRLSQQAIPFKLDRGGTRVLIAATDVARARVALARNGGLPGGKRPGFELFDQPSWGQTDLTQRVNYRRALEGELERTIARVRGISSVQVHLVMHETARYGEAATPTEATVMLGTKGERLGPEVVKGIAHAVASSVEGLTSDHVTIVDDDGRLLSEADETVADGAISNRQLALQREVETYLRDKAERIVTSVTGPGNARVQVAAVLGFDRIQRTSSSVDPNHQAIAQEQKAEIVPGAQGGAGSTNAATTYQNTTLTENVTSAIGAVRRLSVAVLIAAPKDKTTPTLADAQLSEVERLVRSAVGYDSTRGDVITVAALPMAPAALPEKPAVPSTLDTVREWQRPVLAVVGTLLAFVVAMAAVRTSVRASAARSGSAPPQVAAGNAQGNALGGEAAPAALPRIDIPANPTRERVQASIEQRPEVAAKVMRVWLRDA
jgi:flagellar M-ring protein FliF